MSVKKGFWAFIAAQTFGAFNDNAFKTFVALLAIATMSASQSARLIAVAGGLFIVPFLLFSTYAGWIADRWGKRGLIVLFKVAELALLCASFFALRGPNVPFLLVLLFLMGTHSAFFGPVKLAIVPELVENDQLSNANGIIQMTTFFGIILGTVAAGLLLKASQAAAPLFILVASAGLISSLFIPELAPAGVRESFELNFVTQSWRNIIEVRRMNGVYLSTLGSAYFWFFGALFQMNLLSYGKDLMGVSETVASYFQIVAALGIGLGSFGAGRLSRGQVELGLVPLGALGLVVFSIDLSFAFRSETHAIIDIFVLGLCSGCFLLPLQAFIQEWTPAEERGKVIATGNILAFAGILVASAWFWSFGGFFKLHPGQIFLVVAIMTLVVAGYIVGKLPDFLTRLLMYPIANFFYRIRVDGRENVPARGGVLLVSNHVSFIDALLIAMSNQRLVRFLMFRTYYDLPVFRHFFRAMGCIPISDRDSPKAILASFENAREALRQGEVVCIFAEGEISRHGQMLRFKKGFERIVDGISAPIVPVHLDQLWGSIFSFEGGRLLFKWPRRVPYPVTVSFGKPMSPTSTAFQVRQAILELGADAFRHRIAKKPPLALAFSREAKRHPLRFAVADSTGARLNYASLLARAYAVGRALDDGGEEPMGLLLPPSIPAVAANVGLALAGRLAINLNYTSSKDVVASCIAKAGIRRIITSRRFVEKLGWQPDVQLVYLEDVAAGISKVRAALSAGALWFWPSWLLERTLLRKANVPLDDLATVMFTSGSSGTPKGVMVTQTNILANIEGVAQVYQLKSKEVVLGILPFFHSFGFTGTLWLPLVSGCSAIYHFNPLDAKRVGELAKQYGATFLLGTPTFLTMYVRRVEAEQFKSLKHVVVGAEKLREDVAKAFEEKFGVAPLEGYGCTELSPVAAANIPDIDWPGVHQKGGKPGSIGHPLPGVAMKVVDLESRAPLPPATPGLILVKGLNVMKGYLGDDEKTQEVLHDGYYVTGDIGSIDLDGFVTITDRLSRFSKIAGEMVPHIKVEEKLHELAGLVEQTFVVVGVPDEKRGERLVVLCKDYEAIDGLCKKLNDSGVPKLWIPARSNFHKVMEIPILGSGKLDLQKIKIAANELETRPTN